MLLGSWQQAIARCSYVCVCVSADEQTSVHVLTRVKMRFDVVGVQKDNPWAVTGDATWVGERGNNILKLPMYTTSLPREGTSNI